MKVWYYLVEQVAKEFYLSSVPCVSASEHLAGHGDVVAYRVCQIGLELEDLLWGKGGFLVVFGSHGGMIGNAA